MINIILLITALLLASVLIPFAIVYVFVSSIIQLKPKKFLGFMNATAIELALTIDRIGNVVCRDPFNDLLRHNDGYRFGKRKETISSALGKNQRDGTLKSLGYSLANILDRIDPEHCKKSIDNTV